MDRSIFKKGSQKATLCGSLSMGHYTIKNSRVVIMILLYHIIDLKSQRLHIVFKKIFPLT